MNWLNLQKWMDFAEQIRCGNSSFESNLYGDYRNMIHFSFPASALFSLTRNYNVTL